LLYRVTNAADKPVNGDLFLAIRPFQVNPPYQWLNTVGGVARIDRIALSESRRSIEVDDRLIALGEAPDAFGAAVFDEGDVTSFLSGGEAPPHARVTDSQHAASAAIQYHFHIKPGRSREWALCVPFSGDERHKTSVMRPMLTAADPVRYVRERQQAVATDWIAATSTVDLLVPAEAADVVDTIRSTLAYILINRDGAGIQPGSRSYERSWIRDGSLTAAALLRFGLQREAREFVDWYAPYQFESGKVPCVVDRRGPDPVPENDSHGQLIMAFKNLPTYGGRLSCTIERAKSGSDRLIAQIDGTLPMPSGGIRLVSPLGTPSSAKINGAAANIDGDGHVVVTKLPAKLELQIARGEGR
jgi:hypothetical protein